MKSIRPMSALVAAILLVGCASADQKMASKRNYRESQVAAIAVQENGRVDRAHAEALEQQAMWKALAEVVKANPEAASHVAIVAAVAAVSGKDEGGRQEATMVTLRGEQDAALQWAQALAGPVLGTVGSLGVAAINNDMQKAIVRETTKVSIAQTEQDGRLYDVIGSIASNRLDGGSGDSYVISDQGILNQSGTVTAHTNNNSATATSAATPSTTPAAAPTMVPTTTPIDDPIVSTFSPEEEPYLYNGDVPKHGVGRPDYDAGYDGDSIGGLVETGLYGEEVIWDTPSFVGTLGVGDVLETPQGNYQVVDTREGTVGLLPIGDAHRGGGLGGYEVMWNVVVGEVQFGIDAYTGEAWVQEAVYMPGPFTQPK